MITGAPRGAGKPSPRLPPTRDGGNFSSGFVETDAPAARPGVYRACAGSLAQAVPASTSVSKMKCVSRLTSDVPCSWNRIV
jgi:hypothetical protein